MEPWAALNIQFLLPPFLLVLFRVAGLTITAPILSSRVVPRRVKVAISLVISLLIFPLVLPLMPSGLTLEAVVRDVIGTGFVVDVSIAVRVEDEKVRSVIKDGHLSAV